MSVKIIHAALDEKDGNIILRGVIDPGSIPNILIPDYQREEMPLSSLSSLVEALKKSDSGVPDIYLGMRSGNFIEREKAFYLKDNTYVIDGLQRLKAAQRVKEFGGEPRLGVMVHFNTNEEWEREMFRKLNCLRTRVSPNIILRNHRDSNKAIGTLYQLSHEAGFVMEHRISWSQRMKRNELVSAMTYLYVASILHSHLSPGRNKNLEYLPTSLEKMMTVVGRNTLRNNIKTFYDVLDEAFGVRHIAYREAAVYVRTTFLICLAEIFSKYPEIFWNGNTLIIERSWRKKLSLFALDDPNIAKLASASGSARDVLRTLLINHLNSGKRTKRLTEKFNIISDQEEIGDSEEFVTSSSM